MEMTFLFITYGRRRAVSETASEVVNAGGAAWLDRFAEQAAFKSGTH